MEVAARYVADGGGLGASRGQRILHHQTQLGEALRPPSWPCLATMSQSGALLGAESASLLRASFWQLATGSSSHGSRWTTLLTQSALSLSLSATRRLAAPWYEERPFRALRSSPKTAAARPCRRSSSALVRLGLGASSPLLLDNGRIPAAAPARAPVVVCTRLFSTFARP